MKEQKANPSDKSVNTPILGQTSDNSKHSKKTDHNPDKKPSFWKRRKLIRTTKDIGSVLSVIFTLYKIFQEFGLLP